MHVRNPDPETARGQRGQIPRTDLRRGRQARTANGGRTRGRQGDDAKAAKVPREKRVAVKAEEVLAFKDYGTHVVVVTKDGQKLTSSGEE